MRSTADWFAVAVVLVGAWTATAVVVLVVLLHRLARADSVLVIHEGPPDLGGPVVRDGTIPSHSSLPRLTGGQLEVDHFGRVSEEDR